jgi:hypothetical protein
MFFHPQMPSVVGYQKKPYKYMISSSPSKMNDSVGVIANGGFVGIVKIIGFYIKIIALFY